MPFLEFEIKQIAKQPQTFLDKRRPPVHIRKELDIDYRIDGNSIFKIRPLGTGERISSVGDEILETRDEVLPQEILFDSLEMRIDLGCLEFLRD